MQQLSYTCGPQNQPLLAMTIGQAFDDTVARFASREVMLSELDTTAAQ